MEIHTMIGRKIHFTQRQVNRLLKDIKESKPVTIDELAQMVGKLDDKIHQLEMMIFNTRNLVIQYMLKKRNK